MGHGRAGSILLEEGRRGCFWGVRCLGPFPVLIGRPRFGVEDVLAALGSRSLSGRRSSATAPILGPRSPIWCSFGSMPRRVRVLRRLARLSFIIFQGLLVGEFGRRRPVLVVIIRGGRSTSSVLSMSAGRALPRIVVPVVSRTRSSSSITTVVVIVPSRAPPPSIVVVVAIPSRTPSIAVVATLSLIHI